jgi:diketogulonate reductase-like aldo/keto reductase
MTFKDALKLNNGKEMPILGLGTWQVTIFMQTKKSLIRLF